MDSVCVLCGFKTNITPRVFFLCSRSFAAIARTISRYRLQHTNVTKTESHTINMMRSSAQKTREKKIRSTTTTTQNTQSNELLWTLPINYDHWTVTSRSCACACACACVCVWVCAKLNGVRNYTQPATENDGRNVHNRRLNGTNNRLTDRIARPY